MSDIRFAAPCGLFCGDCEYLGERCEGCGAVEGRPFWTAEMKMDSCPLYECAVTKRQLEHCGACNELPCGLFESFHDPALSPEEAEQSTQERTRALLRRKEIGTEHWLEEMG